ncbi:hypothetical protein Q8W25_04660 [Shimia thalassica]|uniref:hypothetical protein n=1 Tax=Shimia thalassica TaxID=1715693 RepID=UPI002735C483|nr:hypothetical protein [Shimia thalassica]MDP2493295.1 hypothetical protein [Shimia thalassica]
MQVSETEFGLIRIFSVDEPESGSALFDHDLNSEDCLNLVQSALGATHLDPDYGELFAVADLEEVGLRGYMVQGLGIAEADVTQDALRLDALSGTVLIVLSKAFGGHAQELSPKSPLRWVGTYREEKAPVHYEPLPSSGSVGVVEEPPHPHQPNPHLNVLWAVLALPILLIFVGIIGFLLFK